MQVETSRNSCFAPAPWRWLHAYDMCDVNHAQFPKGRCSNAGAALPIREVLKVQKRFLEAEALYGGCVDDVEFLRSHDIWCRVLDTLSSKQV